MYDVAIIGAGASGLMAASFLQNSKVALIDSNKTIGEKIKISGGGKCNITNKYLSPYNYLGDPNKIETVFQKFDNNQLLEFLNKNGVSPKIDEKIVKGTYFCNRSEDILSLFKKLTSKTHYYLEHVVKDVAFENETFSIFTDQKVIQSKKLIVASGGLSYPILGASDIGYKIAKKFGHTINKLDPALVGFTVQKDQFWFKQLSGLSVDVKIGVRDKQIEGKMLFAHKGCSGPAILTASLYWNKGEICINFLPYKTSYLPKRLKKILNEKNIDPKNYCFAPAGNFGYTKAEVTKGGVAFKQLDETMQSIYQKNLYFIGEVVDVTGELGGYNFQWAFSSAYSSIEKSNKYIL
jgi:predicted Rossmann fold flavoprotein